jgi:hypothetical protein
MRIKVWKIKTMGKQDHYFRLEFQQDKWIKITREQLNAAYTSFSPALRRKLLTLKKIWLNAALFIELSQMELERLQEIGSIHGFMHPIQQPQKKKKKGRRAWTQRKSRSPKKKS